MKLQSKTICPVELRDKIVNKWGPIDNGVNDMRLALETAEQQCFELNKKNIELNKENGELEQYVAHAKNKINDLGGNFEGYQPTDELTSDPPNGNINNEQS